MTGDGHGGALPIRKVKGDGLLVRRQNLPATSSQEA